MANILACEAFEASLAACRNEIFLKDRNMNVFLKATRYQVKILYTEVVADPEKAYSSYISIASCS